MIKQLLSTRRFLPLLITQFFGAFNDNAFKLAMLTLISYHLASNQAESEHYQALAAGLFTLPFFLFSSTAGQLADKFDKARIAVIVKCFEVILMVLGAYALYQSNKVLLLVTLCAMGLHSTFFGPVKYALLPQHLQSDELLAGNGLIEASTFVAILLGTVLGTLSIGGTAEVGLAILLLLLCALSGLMASLWIPQAPSSNQQLTMEWNIAKSTWQLMRLLVADKQLLLIVLLISWFWFVGAMILTKLPDYTHFQLGADSSVFALFLALFSIGIASGSLMINQLLKAKVTVKLAPIGLLGISVFAIDLFFSTPNVVESTSLISFTQFIVVLSNWRIMADFFLLALSGGTFIVPLYAMLQLQSDEKRRASMIAANNIVNALYMVLAAMITGVLAYFKVDIHWIFVLLAVVNALMMFKLYPLLPSNYIKLLFLGEKR